MEEPGGLQSMGSQRVGHDWVTSRVVKNPPVNEGHIRNACPIHGWGRSPGGRHGNPPQYFCLENPTDRGAWWPTVHSVQRVRHDWGNLAYTYANTVTTISAKVRIEFYVLNIELWKLHPENSAWRIILQKQSYLTHNTVHTRQFIRMRQGLVSSK